MRITITYNYTEGVLLGKPLLGINSYAAVTEIHFLSRPQL